MSDFASLLGNLQKSADRASSAGPVSTRDDHEGTKPCKSKKRRRNSDASAEVKDRHFQRERCERSIRQAGPPRDIRDLSISVSFLCIGAQKAGTTWLHEMLRQNPRLSLPDQKELHFWDWNRRKGLGWYSKQFTSTKEHKTCLKSKQQIHHPPLYGEITPCYAVLPDQDIQEIRALFPKVRIIFLARNLIDRAWSALLMELRNANRGVQRGNFTIEDDIDERQQVKLDQESNPEEHSDDYFMAQLTNETHTCRSDYASGLRRWLDHFPKEQLLIVDYREVSKNPRETVEQIMTHIGSSEDESKRILDSMERDQLFNKKFNAATGSTAGKPIRHSLRAKMERYLNPFVKDFNDLLQELGYNWKL
eukprot:scaffold17420_cov39-Attheya_sp.AAC.1